MFYKKHMDCLLKELLSLKAQIDEKENFFIKSINDKYEYINKQITYLYESNESYEKAIKEIQESCTEHEDFKNETLKRLERFANKIVEIEKQQNTIIECLNHDRKDINCLIQIIKKINQNKRKNND